MAASLATLRLSAERRCTALSKVRFASSGNGNEGDEKKAKAKAKLSALLTSIKNSKVDSSVKTVELARPGVAPATEKEDVTGLEPEVVHAAHRLAVSIAKGADDRDRHETVRKTESDLIRKLKGVVAETEEARMGGGTSLSSLMQNLKVQEKKPPRQIAKREEKPPRQIAERGDLKPLTADQIKFLQKRRQQRTDEKLKAVKASYSPVDIFSAEPPLGIFSEKVKNGEDRPEILEMWKKCREREMKILSMPPPRNLLEDMANMTDRGILWHFPINNEQGIAEEDMEPFHQHVFLEHHLEPWCPKKGPLRHFMELVCVGLSKNSHISVARKVQHIMWYKDYFEASEHNDILRGSGAYDG